MARCFRCSNTKAFKRSAMKNWSVNASCLASFLFVLLIVHTTSFKSEAISDESINREILEWRHERNKAQLSRMMKGNSAEHEKKSVDAVFEGRDENKNATDMITPQLRTIFDVLKKSNPCPKGQKTDHAGNCRAEFGPNTD
ncbi:unnamed protein product [Xylocopa violacea]|uniref:Uncharacterized protein n=1 Tax=Xylocopa violacea TaxID=135666 RepID=A0ABP1P5L3_XYLVO